MPRAFLPSLFPLFCLRVLLHRPDHALDEYRVALGVGIFYVRMARLPMSALENEPGSGEIAALGHEAYGRPDSLVPGLMENTM